MDKKLLKQLEENIEEIVEELKSDLIDNFQQEIEKTLWGIFTVEKDKYQDKNNKNREYFRLDIRCPDVTIGDDNSVKIKASNDNGFSYGFLAAKAIKEYIKENPNENPKKIIRSIIDDFYILIDEAIDDLSLDRDEVWDYTDEDEKG